MKSIEAIKDLRDKVVYGVGKYEHLYDCLSICEHDLEVLEILKNKQPDIREVNVSHNFEAYKSFNDVLYKDKWRLSLLLTEEEFNKLKEWLERK